MPNWVSDYSPFYVPIAIIISAIVGALMILLQLNKQHKQNINLQREQFKQKLYLDIFEEIVDRMVRAQASLLEIHSDVSWFVIEVKQVQISQKYGLNQQIKYTSNKLIDAHYEAVENIHNMMGIFEKYEIALPMFRTIRKSFFSEVRELTKIFDQFNSLVSKFLPFESKMDESDTDKKTLIYRKLPNDTELESIRKLTEEYSRKCITIFAYFFDVGVELQNNLLGGLFDRRVLPRNPKDKSDVLSVDFNDFSERPDDSLI